MGEEKKKWYQTGEFEDGYQFGDIFRTVKNVVSEKKEDKTDKIKTVKQSKDTVSTKATVGAVKNGRLLVDPAAQLYGFENEDERQRYIKDNPNLYAVMGGIKYDPSVLSKNYIPLTVEGKKIVAEAQEKDEYIKSIQYKLDIQDYFRAEEKRSKGISLTDREIEAETKLKWLYGEIGKDDVKEYIEKSKALNSVLTKFDSGEEINLSERLLLTENGGKNYTEGDAYKTIDFLAKDNPENITAHEKYESAIKKKQRGEKLTLQEQADISNYQARNYIRQSIVNDKYTLSNNTKENAENLNTMSAVKLYNDAIYKKGIDRTFAQMELYTNTGLSKYFQDTVNTANIFLTELAYHSGLSDERASDVLKNISKNRFEIANDAVAQNFAINDKKFSKFVQDTTVSLANNAVPMLLGGISGGASLVATGLSVFGGSYSEAVEISPEAEEWRYWVYAGINTAIEVSMEKLLSGDKNIFANTGSDFSEAMFKALSKNIGNKILLKGIYVLSNSTGEFLEESIQGLLSPILQEMILDADTVSILSKNRSEQLQSIKNALYDGLVGFVSAGLTTGMLGSNAVKSKQQKETIGTYYKKVLNESNVDIENVAVYLKEVSSGENNALHKATEKVLRGDKSDDTVAEMMINGFEECRDVQRFVYTKIGETINKNNKYTVYSLIKQYDRLSNNGIRFSKSIAETYNELANTDESTSVERYNYLVGKLSTAMDAVVPRASVANEVKKKITENKLLEDSQIRKESKNIDENEVIAGIWDGSPDTTHHIKNTNFEKSQGESVENVGGILYNKSNSLIALSTSGSSGEKASPYPTKSVPHLINRYLKSLKKYGDILNVKEPPSFSDISLMSRQSGTEYASITIGNEHYIIKGNTKGTPIPNEIFEKIKLNKGTLNCHSHPFIDDFRVSKADINVAKQMYWQKEFYIVSPDGKFATYGSNGIIDIDIIKKKLDGSDYEFYSKLFEED